MPELPTHPNLDQLRHQARDLLRAARSGNSEATARIPAVADRLTLGRAQLALAREYGFVSWAKLKAEVEVRNKDLAKMAEAFCQASIGDWTGGAARMLAADPELGTYSFATAVVLGDVARVRQEIERDPGLATRADERSGWTPLHAVCASRWHRLDPDRADGLLAVARVLLDAGADATVETNPPRAGANHWNPLRCAVAGVANPAIARLLLERGALPDDHDLYLAGFGNDDHQSLRLLLEHMPNVAATARQALAAPVSLDDAEGVRLLLEGGADPSRYADDDGKPCAAVPAAIRAECSAKLVGLLLLHGADPNGPGADGRSPLRLATGLGRSDLVDVLRRAGAHDDTTDVERFLFACLQADRGAAARILADSPDLPDRLSDDERGALPHAAESGNTAALRLMLDLGFPLEARGADGGTALHHAAYAGGIEAVRLLLERGADIEARDTSWDDTPLGWAMVGSGQRPRRSLAPDWVATVRVLLAAGASTRDITLSPDAANPPSPEVAQLLRGYGIGNALEDMIHKCHRFD
ncbi:MAG TPA: ankyrin repeat domain-containing protein [Chloroflexota bacterium]